MQKSKRRHSFEERAEFQSKQGTLSTEHIAEAIKRIGDYDAKASALTEKSSEIYNSTPPAGSEVPDRIYADAQARIERANGQADTWTAKARRLSAIPEVAAALARRESRS